MIKFEEHEGKLFKMLEEPTPLTPDAEMPCLVGTPVKEGSPEWALYQMMKGKKVAKQHLQDSGNVYWCFCDRPRCVQEFNCGTLQIMVTPEIWVKTVDKCGWQIYHEPAPQYKVGDWVKYDIDYYLQVIEPSGKERTLCRTLSGVNVYPCTSLLTKVSPSEVVIDFGSFSGWIKRASNYNIEVYSKGNCWLANLRFDMLDAPTRELVEGLLKAQNEEKLKGDNND